MLEIERKYLVSKEEAEKLMVAATRECRIMQGYIAFPQEGVVRIRESKAYRPVSEDAIRMLTIKLSPPAGTTGVIEVEKPLTEQEFEAMWPHASQRIVKTRFEIPITWKDVALTIELDVFGEALSGLILAEIECPDEATYHALAGSTFDWALEDVTGDPQYFNSQLGKKTAVLAC